MDGFLTGVVRNRKISRLSLALHKTRQSRKAAQAAAANAQMLAAAAAAGGAAGEKAGEAGGAEGKASAAAGAVSSPRAAAAAAAAAASAVEELEGGVLGGGIGSGAGGGGGGLAGVFAVARVCSAFVLRVHQFTFQWELALHLSVCVIGALLPFFFTHGWAVTAFGSGLWLFYNALFILGARHVSGFNRLKKTFVEAIEELMPARLLPVLSISFALMLASIHLTAEKIGGPPLCYRSCRTCLAQWENAVPLPANMSSPDMTKGCGYENGKEMLGYYTICQSGLLPYVCVLVTLLTCLAWRVADDENREREAAEEWLKGEDSEAFNIRERLLKAHGRPGSKIRPTTDVHWLLFGVVAAFTFTILGWKAYETLPRSASSTLLIAVNSLTIIVSTIILHVGFYGRLITLYQRNLRRVQELTSALRDIHDTQLNGWWNARNFVLTEDLSLDYDIGGLAVSTTFFLVVTSFLVLVFQFWREGFGAVLSPPGSYCAYASVYLTICLIRVFGLATKTFEEQSRHIEVLQAKSLLIMRQEEAEQLRLLQASSSPPSGHGHSHGRGHGAYDQDEGVDGAGRRRTRSASIDVVESKCREIAHMIEQIRDYDPYPCIFGIPVMPSLFTGSKLFVYLLFLLTGSKLMIFCIRAAVNK